MSERQTRPIPGDHSARAAILAFLAAALTVVLWL